MRLLEEHSGMGVDGIGEGDRASERQAAGVYGAGFTAGSLAGKGARRGTRGTGNKVSFDKKVCTSVHIIPTNHQQYLHFSSCHPHPLNIL